ncbi:MAG: phospholipase [Aquihabitans sp.]
MLARRLIAASAAAATLFTLAPTAPAAAQSKPITATIAPAWGKGAVTIVRTGWTVKVTGTLTDTRADGDCVYVKATLEVDDWVDPDAKTADLCRGKGSSQSINLSLSPGKGSKLSRIRVKVCAADAGFDSCQESVWTVPAEQAAQPSKKATVDSYFNKSMASFQTSKKSKPAGLNWTDDGCSSPTGDKPGGYNFLPACQRHDFGYRNYGKGSIRANPTDAQRLTVDSRFLADMRAECAKYTGAKNTTCRGFASTYYSAVRLAGGKAFYV